MVYSDIDKAAARSPSIIAAWSGLRGPLRCARRESKSRTTMSSDFVIFHLKDVPLKSVGYVASK